MKKLLSLKWHNETPYLFYTRKDGSIIVKYDGVQVAIQDGDDIYTSGTDIMYMVCQIMANGPITITSDTIENNCD